MSCPCDNHCAAEDGVLPTASLDDMAEQIRKEFAEQTIGRPPVAPQATPMVIPEKKKKISQDTFDEVVKENMEEFEMSMEEAMQDAVEQFNQQGVDLSSIITTPEAKRISDAVTQQVDALNELLKPESSDEDALLTTLVDLAKTCATGETERGVAGRHGAVGAACFCVKRYLENRSIVIAALNLLTALLKTFENREVIPFQGAEAVSNCLSHYAEDAEVQAAGFGAVVQAITKHEANKRNLKDLEINTRLLVALDKYHDNETVMTNACKFLRIYLSDDDRRPGVQPGTFARARELGEDYERGVLAPLFRFMARQETVGNERMVKLGLATLKSVCVNDLICKHVANQGGLEYALLAFEAHITDENVAANGCMLLKAVSRNDDIKRTVGKGKGLGLLLRAIDEHLESPRVTEQALGCLSVLCLRQPQNCEIIADLGCLQLIVSTMQKHPEQPMVQRHSVSTLRNMVSSWQNKDLTGKILDEGVENLIRKARAEHPEMCEEVCYAALRDLGLDYHS